MSPGKKKTTGSTKAAGKKTVKAPRRQRVLGERSVYLFILCLCLLQMSFLTGVLYFYNSLGIPDLRSVANYRPAEASIIYDRRGNIVDRIFVENRTVVTHDQMAPFLAAAFVSAEDGRFFEHPGLDFFSVLRAAVHNLKDGARSQGGSTITQQVIKSLLLTPEKTYIRKLKESILAYRIDKLLNKMEILYVYLNQIYLGEGAYGVEAAAQTYFGKSARMLSLGECALLAGLPQAPSRYSLFSHLDRAVERQRYVLNRMAAEGYITDEDAQKAFNEKVRLNPQRQAADDENAYYLDVVKKEARAYLHKPLQTAGAKIYTTLDSAIQKNAFLAVKKGVEESRVRQISAGVKVDEPLQAALVCLENKSGKVRALVGGISHKASPFNRATQARRPVGSTFKPFVYAAALEQGMTPDSKINDAPLAIRGRDGKPWTPRNYSGRYHGQTTLAEALAGSYNVSAVRLLRKVGNGRVERLARASGITAALPPDLSLALGSADVSLLEMTDAYLPFSGDGSAVSPLFIEKIVLPDGTVVSPKRERARKPVLNARVYQQMRQMLYQVVFAGTGKKAAVVPGVRGGKTGTSDACRDGWFVGYDTRYTTGVWIGYDHNHPMGRAETGGNSAAPIWRDFMLKLVSR
ncbi:MAG: penicillin-binding protein [Deltaproteobacteria bacterium]|nr:MAG: penicillin-binding protein [Deltaproteobacteria bacterium]